MPLHSAKKSLWTSLLILWVSSWLAACPSSGTSERPSVVLTKTRAITAYSLNGTPGTLVGENIAVTVPYGTNVTQLTATFTTTGASVTVRGVTQVSGITPNDFTSPVKYTVIAANGSTQDYTVIVTVASVSSKTITAYALNDTPGTLVGKNIAVTVPYGTDITQLTATFITTGKSVTVGQVAQKSGTTPNNFTHQVIYTVTAADGSTAHYTVIVTVASVSSKAITAYALNGTPGTISGKNIAVTVPYGTDLTDSVASFTMIGADTTVNGAIQVSGSTPNNFTRPVIYTVTATDGSTVNYTVIGAVALKAAKAITNYSFPGSPGTIIGKNITVTVPYQTDVTNLIATFTTTGQSVTVNQAIQVSGSTPNDFTPPVIYTVTAADGSTANYTVTVTVALNSAKEITGYWLDRVHGTITGPDIAVTVPYATDVTSLIAIFTTTGQSVTVNGTTQINGITTNNFTHPVTYTVTAADGTTQDYTVTVTVALSPAKEITSYSLAGHQGNFSGQSIAVPVPYPTDVNDLVATFTTTGQSVTVGSAPQISGSTPNNFTHPVIYTVTAADGTTQDYTVTVTVAPAPEIVTFSLAKTILDIKPSHGIVSQTSQTIAVSVPSGTNVSSLIAYFTTQSSTGGVVVAIGGTTQSSGHTTNNFTHPVIYTVTAADGSTQSYTVTVTVRP